MLIESKDFRDDAAGLREKIATEKIATKEIPLEILQKALNTWAALTLEARAEDNLLASDLRAARRHPPQRRHWCSSWLRPPFSLRPRSATRSRRCKTAAFSASTC